MSYWNLELLGHVLIQVGIVGLGQFAEVELLTVELDLHHQVAKGTKKNREGLESFPIFIF
jgi:hypothetical protein